MIELDDTGIIDGYFNGATISQNGEFRIEEAVTSYGTSQILVYEDYDTGREYLFLMGGATFPAPTNLTEFISIASTVSSISRVTSGPFAPSTPFSVTDLYGVTSADGPTVNGTSGDDSLTGGSTHDLIQGFSGNDTIDGGDGSDEINPGTNTDYDIVHTGGNSDWVDYSDSTYGSQVLTYAGDATAVTVYVNGTDNEGDVQQGDSWDTLENVATPMTWSESNPLAGFMVIGTSGADTFNVNADTNQFIAVRGGDGADSYNVWGNGSIRLDLYGGTQGANVDLSGYTIANDGFGNVESLNGNVTEVRGTDHADFIRGSFADEAFILHAGDDTLDALGGFDRLRYDRSGVTGVDANMATGVVTGTWDGIAFTHQVSGVEYVRGSDSADVLTASINTQQFRGNDGADRFVLALNGTLTIDDFEVGTDTLDVTALGVTGTEVDAALASASDVGGGVQISLNGAIVTFSGVTAAEAPNIDYVGETSGNPSDQTFLFNDTDLTFQESSDGDDLYNFSGLTAAYASVSYTGRPQGIMVDIDGAANTGSVDKGVDGTDTFFDVANPMNLGFSTGGFGITGTEFADVFIIHTDASQWIGISGEGGGDSFTISGDGRVRLDYSGAASGINADLSTGNISDGTGSSDTVTGNLWEIRATHHNDSIVGSDQNESFILRGGTDTLDGGLGVDRVRYDRNNVGDVEVDLTAGTASGLWDSIVFNHTLSGIEDIRGSGAGNDTLTGSADDNRIWGRGGNDSIRGEGGDDRLYGGEGNDTFDGGAGTDVLDYSLDEGNGATSGIDVTMTGIGVGTVVDGFGGTDTFTGIEQIDGTDFADRMVGHDGNNEFEGDDGNDTLNGAGGDDTLDGGDGTDILIGGDGNDVIYGGATEDDLRDVVYAGAGNDFVDGGYGNDELRGDGGNDTISGGFGVDTVIGMSGDDVLTGQAWSDLIYGGDDNDFINGGFGYDRLNGGSGADRFFHIGIYDHGSDWIQDYNAAEGDVLQFGQAGTRDQFQLNYAETANAGVDGVEEVFVIYIPTNQILWALVDGGAQSEINLLMGGVTYDLMA